MCIKISVFEIEEIFESSDRDAVLASFSLKFGIENVSFEPDKNLCTIKHENEKCSHEDIVQQFNDFGFVAHAIHFVEKDVDLLQRNAIAIKDNLVQEGLLSNDVLLILKIEGKLIISIFYYYILFLRINFRKNNKVENLPIILLFSLDSQKLLLS